MTSRTGWKKEREVGIIKNAKITKICHIAQETIFSVLSETIMEQNQKKENLDIYIYMHNQARLQQYVSWELPDVHAGIRKGRETRDQIANIRWIIEKAKELQKNIYFCFIDCAKAFDYIDHNYGKFLKR